MADDMTGNGAGAVRQTALQALERLAVEMRPQLHRYCARMTGSVIDGEDVLQEALLKAFEAARTAPAPAAKASRRRRAAGVIQFY